MKHGHLADCNRNGYNHFVVYYKPTDESKGYYVSLYNETRLAFDIGVDPPQKGLDFGMVVDESYFTDEITNTIESAIDFYEKFQVAKQANIIALLDKKFVYAEPFAMFLSQMFKAESNGIAHGIGGYGKSEQSFYVMEQLGLLPYTFIKSLSEGTTDTDLYGGINLAKYRDEGELLYNLEDAFVNKEIVILEEILDAPPQALTSLKDALTSGVVRFGKQMRPIKCKIILGLTNKQPKDLEFDPSVEALLQRFPLQIEAVWHEHNKDRYTNLLRKVYLKSWADNNMKDISEMAQYIELVAESIQSLLDINRPPSPRMALTAMNQVIKSRKHTPSAPIQDHMAVMRFVKGFEEVTGDIQDQLDLIARRETSKKVIIDLEESIEVSISLLSDVKTIADLQSFSLNVANEFKKFALAGGATTDEYAREAQIKRNTLTALFQNAERLARDMALNDAGLDGASSSYGLQDLPRIVEKLQKHKFDRNNTDTYVLDKYFR